MYKTDCFAAISLVSRVHRPTSVMEDVLAAAQNPNGNEGWGDANFISSNLILELVTQMKIRECL